MLNSTIDRVEQLSKVQDEALELFKKKNHDYGDAFADYDVVGVIVRLGDKVKRCQSISKTGIQLVDSEKMRDTLIDMHNYAAMAIMLMDEKSLDDELVLEDNVECMTDSNDENNGYKLLHKWEIEGDSKKKYIRECYWNYSSKSHIQTCTCPSFMYNGKKTCKHIQHSEKYKIIKSLVYTN
tara:strand:- start:3309 stop:3851 length:543 start_codon:yes stop_codon:yes gene_type:complete